MTEWMGRLTAPRRPGACRRSGPLGPGESVSTWSLTFSTREGRARVFRVLHPELGKDYVLKLALRPTQKARDAEAGQADRPRVCTAKGGC